jgi:hypothetical protein
LRGKGRLLVRIQNRGVQETKVFKTSHVRNHKRTEADCIGPLASLPNERLDGGGRIGCARSLAGAAKAACWRKLSSKLSQWLEKAKVIRKGNSSLPR